MTKKISAVITDALGDRVVVLAEALAHTVERHFPLFPDEMVLELIERILRDPTDIFEEQKSHVFHLFYRLTSKHYMVAIVKRVPDGCFFVTAYPTGTTQRAKHKKLRRIRHDKT
jgi:phage-Barnase-EndoU-ColicinE5/D-RelE like nuclease2